VWLRREGGGVRERERGRERDGEGERDPFPEWDFWGNLAHKLS